MTTNAAAHADITLARTPLTDSVICPNCAHEFVGVPVDIQQRISEFERANAERTATAFDIGSVRRALFVPWDSKWNAFVRDITARLEIDPRCTPGLIQLCRTAFRELLSEVATKDAAASPDSATTSDQHDVSTG